MRAEEFVLRLGWVLALVLGLFALGWLLAGF